MDHRRVPMQFPKLFPEQLGTVSRAILLSFPGLEALREPTEPREKDPWNHAGDALRGTSREGAPGINLLVETSRDGS